MEWVTWYVVFVNITGIIVVKIDKQRAVKGSWRIPEKRLWLLSILGGSIGVYFAMKQFRHKTKHKRFMIGIPMIVILQVLFCYLLINTA